MPHLKIYLWDEDKYEPDEITYAFVWRPPSGALATMRNLEAVISAGTGVSHIIKDPTYPKSVPLLRTIGEPLQNRMCEYVTLHVLLHHRRILDQEMAQRERRWHQFIEPLASDMNVGVLGLGYLGGAAASALTRMGYKVHGWSRRGRPVQGVAIYTGKDGLHELVSRSDVLVCLLPDTGPTENILNRDLFWKMPSGSALINVGRGEHLVEDDLLRAIDAGHISAATLDVFRDEPLPESSPLWTHDRIIITAHTACAIDPRVGAPIIARLLNRFMTGQPMPEAVDLSQGY
jgi:glyoxylate/hydroxypyruvate reductase A